MSTDYAQTRLISLVGELLANKVQEAARSVAKPDDGPPPPNRLLLCSAVKAMICFLPSFSFFIVWMLVFFIRFDFSWF